MATPKHVTAVVESRQYRYEESSPELIHKELRAFTEMERDKEEEVVYSFDMYRHSDTQKIFSNDIENDLLIGNHRHDFYEINYVAGGRLYEYINDEFVTLEKGALLILHPDTFHALYPAPNSFCINILVDHRFFEELAREFSLVDRQNIFVTAIVKKAYYILDINGVPALGEIVTWIYRNYRWKQLSAGLFDELLLETRLRQLFLELLIALQKEQVAIIGFAFSTYEDRAERILNYIRDNYTTTNTADVCRKFGYSQMQLHRILKKYAGCSFLTLINRKRLNQAITLLTGTTMPIDEIARSVGLEKTYFFRFVRKETGRTPLEIRKGKPRRA